MTVSPSRIGAATAVAMHVAVVAALLSYAPARTALLSAAPIMVDWIAAPRPEPKIEPPAEAPKPHPVRKPKPVERPVLAVPPQAPAPIVAPEPPPPPVAAAPAPAPAPAALSAPIFNADYLENPAPAYPPLSRRMHEEGKVILRVLVNPSGRADEVQVRSSSGFARLDDSARDTVRQWKFVPAKRGSEPVSAWVLIPVSFRLEG